MNVPWGTVKKKRVLVCRKSGSATVPTTQTGSTPKRSGLPGPHVVAVHVSLADEAEVRRVRNGWGEPSSRRGGRRRGRPFTWGVGHGGTRTSEELVHPLRGRSLKTDLVLSALRTRPEKRVCVGHPRLGFPLETTSFLPGGTPWGDGRRRTENRRVERVFVHVRDRTTTHYGPTPEESLENSALVGTRSDETRLESRNVN